MSEMSKSKSKKRSIDDLIAEIYLHGVYTDVGGSAIRELVQHGVRGLEALMESSRQRRPSPLHGRDLADTISEVYAEFAIEHSAALIERMHDERLGPARVYWSLAMAKSSESIDVLIRGLSDPSQWTRQAAVYSLLRRQSKKSVPILIERLKDRAPSIRACIVFEMRAGKWLRVPAALPQLRKMRDSAVLKKRSPGTWKATCEVIELLEAEGDAPNSSHKSN